MTVTIRIDRIPGFDDEADKPRTWKALQALLEAAGRSIGQADQGGRLVIGESRVGEIWARAHLLSQGSKGEYVFDVDIQIDQP